MFAVLALFSDMTVQNITNDPQLMLSAAPPIVTFGIGTITANATACASFCGTARNTSAGIMMIPAPTPKVPLNTCFRQIALAAMNTHRVQT